MERRAHPNMLSHTVIRIRGLTLDPSRKVHTFNVPARTTFVLDTLDKQRLL